jgi:hypothetical protein
MSVYLCPKGLEAKNFSVIMGMQVSYFPALFITGVWMIFSRAAI